MEAVSISLLSLFLILVPHSISAAVLIFLLVFVAFDAELNQAVDEIGIDQSGRGPQFGIHADGGESGHGVDLVQVDFARSSDPSGNQRGPGRSNPRPGRRDGHLLDLLRFGLGEFGGDDQLLSLRRDTSRCSRRTPCRERSRRGPRLDGSSLPRTEHSISRALLFLAADALLNDDFAIEFGGFFNGWPEFFAVVRFAEFPQMSPGSPASRTPDTSACSRPASELSWDRFPTRCGGSLRASRSEIPAAMNSDFMMSLSMPAAEPRTPAPT